MPYSLETNLREYLKLKVEEKLQFDVYTIAERKWRGLNEKATALEKGDPGYFGVGANIRERYINLDNQVIRIEYKMDYKIIYVAIVRVEDI